MFVVVSRRPELSLKFSAVLPRFGSTRHADGIADVQIALGEKAPSLIIADAKLAAAVHPSVIQEWLRQCSNTRLLVADTTMTPLDELAALAAGAVACCDETLPGEELERVVDVVLHGGVWVSKAAIPLLMSKLQAFAGPAATATASLPTAPLSDGLEGLTERQRDVAKMVGRGASNKQIARELSISDRTVKAHLTTIFDKLGISDRLQLALHVTGNHRNNVP